jgi:hypothetical protein
MTYAGLKKHIFSNFHTQDIIAAFQRKRGKYEAWLKKFETSPNTSVAPLLHFSDKPAEGYYFCAVCKSLRSYTNAKVLTCNHLQETAEFIKACLKKDATSEAAVSHSQTSCADIEALRTKLDKVEQRLKESLFMNSDLIEDSIGYYRAVKYLKGNDAYAFDTIMSYLKENSVELHGKIVRDLDDEGEE